MTTLTTQQQYIFEETRTYMPKLLRINYLHEHEFSIPEESNNAANERLKIAMVRERVLSVPGAINGKKFRT